MKTRFKKAGIMALLMLLIITAFDFQSVQAEKMPSPLVEAAILVDAETGRILYEKNADASLGIASMTKMMTEYLLFEAIEEGRVSWDQKYTATAFTDKLSTAPYLANVPLREGVSYTVRELYEAMAIYSANAATVGLAEVIAGDEGEFVRQMNAKAKELGLEGTKFVNSTGLSNSDMLGGHPKGTNPDDENLMPARSVAKLAKKLLEDYPQVLETASIVKKTFREGTPDERNMKNYNYMLEGLDYAYEGVDGLKTGTTNFAGYCFTGTAERNGRRLIAVIMNAVDREGTGSYKARFEATRQLFDYGFTEFSVEEVIPAGYQFPVNSSLPVEKGKKENVSIAVAEPVELLIPTAEKEAYEPKLKLEPSILNEGKLQAEVEKGMKVGTANVVHTAGTDYGFLDGSSVSADVVTTEQVEKASWLSLSVEEANDFFSTLSVSAKDFVKGLF